MTDELEQWQLIETAPRDGTFFLSWSEQYGVILTNWPYGCYRGCWSLKDEANNNSGWCGNIDNSAAATHWKHVDLTPPKIEMQLMGKKRPNDRAVKTS